MSVCSLMIARVAAGAHGSAAKSITSVARKPTDQISERTSYTPEA